MRNAVLGAGALVLPLGARTAYAAGSDPVLVVLYQRGAADGLAMVIPKGEQGALDTLRPDLVPAGSVPIDAPGHASEFFHLHPALAPLVPLYDAGQLAIVDATGSNDPTRSHFDAQDFMERAAPGDKGVHDGWLNRALGLLPGVGVVGGISLGLAKAPALAGATRTLAFPAIGQFQIQSVFASERRAALKAMYAPFGGVLDASLGAALDAVDVVQSVPTDTAVVYPDGPLGKTLRDAAALIKADIGVRVVNVDVGGWDTHTNEVARLGALLEDLSASLVAFHSDLGADAERTLLLTMTEFGRTAFQNSQGGSEHGHAGVMLALGGGVAGRRVVLKDNQWPGLAPENLYEGRDLAVTTDFRDVFAEVAEAHLGVADASGIFPGFTPDPANRPGLFPS